ncbi:response regulator [Candidatus Aerophobetes bacterium]|nr:response regulator [Candidatus Aerophobetes bacterium]
MIAELGPPKGANPKVVRGKAEILRKCADAVNITDNQTAIVRMSSIASAVILNQMEIEPVILDLLMSGMDGFEVIKKLKEDPELSKIPILILTSVKETVQREKI